jgi:hypothetical protein
MITLTAKIAYDNGKELVIDKRNLLSMSHNIIDRSDIVLPSFGIISNSGKIGFVDYSGEVRRLAEQNKLSANLPVTISLNDTLNDTHLDCTNFVTRKWNYDPSSKEVSVDIGDRLILWQDIAINTIPYNATTPRSVTCEDIYKNLYNQTPTDYFLVPFESLDRSLRLHLQTINVSFYISQDTTLWGAWTTLAQASFANIYMNNKGQTQFVFDI